MIPRDHRDQTMRTILPTAPDSFILSCSLNRESTYVHRYMQNTVYNRTRPINLLRSS